MAAAAALRAATAAACVSAKHIPEIAQMSECRLRMMASLSPVGIVFSFGPRNVPLIFAHAPAPEEAAAPPVMLLLFSPPPKMWRKMGSSLCPKSAAA
jgi:hypothetical protein